MAASLPGCPIVGFYDAAEGDFTGHQRSIEVGDGKFKVVDKTKAYGFVDSTAKIWFQKFMDDGVEHEYLMTEGLLWTSIYEEAKQIMSRPKNQSMELDEKNMDGSWTFDDNGIPKFFIINEAMIQKLCILGENVEPCFEGAGIAAQFSFDGDFKNKLFSLMEDIRTALSKGGLGPMDENKVIDPALNPEDPELEFKKKEEEEDKKEEKGGNNPFPPKKDDKDKKETDSEDESNSSEKNDDEEDEKKKKAPAKHSLTDEEIAGTELYKTLFNQFQELQKKVTDLETEIAPLREFKNATDKKAKEDMINSFYMLSDDDKKDCIDNIDTYSLDQIEAKLSIICVRNKVSFNLDDDKKQENNDPADPLVYQLGDNDDGDSAPAWIKAVRETAKEMN